MAVTLWWKEVSELFPFMFLSCCSEKLVQKSDLEPFDRVKEPRSVSLPGGLFFLYFTHFSLNTKIHLQKSKDEKTV